MNRRILAPPAVSEHGFDYAINLLETDYAIDLDRTGMVRAIGGVPWGAKHTRPAFPLSSPRATPTPETPRG